MSRSTEMLAELNVYVAAMRMRRAAMESLQQASDSLLRSISCGDAASLGDLLDARAAACRELGKVFSAGPSFDLDIARLAESEHSDVREAAAGVLESRQRIESLRLRVLATQDECEQALRTALADTARQLRDTVEHKKVRSAYHVASPAPPRFLDSMK